MGSELFMPKSEVFLSQIANKVEKLHIIVEKMQFQKDSYEINGTKYNKGYQKFNPPRINNSLTYTN